MTGRLIVVVSRRETPEPRLLVAHVVERADLGVVVGDEHERVAEGLAHVRGDLPLPLGVAGHEGSTILVALNGLRLLRRSEWRPTVDR